MSDMLLLVRLRHNAIRATHTHTHTHITEMGKFSKVRYK